MLTRNLNQTAVYWGTPASDGQGGRTFDEPIDIDCRWENVNELFVDGQGQERRSSAVVYVSVDVVVGGYLYLGTLTDLDSSEEDDPLSVNDAKEIRRFDTTPSLKGDRSMRKIYL
jgi:hypothetical protein